ncbi:uncharacterized protein METZ01_LOCUS15895, partial [marine metagenome]
LLNIFLLMTNLIIMKLRMTCQSTLNTTN